MPKKKKHSGSYSTRLLVLLLLVVLVALGALGWRWQATLAVERIDVVGAEHAPRAALLELARVDTGAVLYDVSAALVADRVQRHPWVGAASVTRLPTGTLRIAVAERVPVLLALGEEGRPSHYIDAAGHQMPLADSVAYDVPLIRGLTAPYHPIRPAQPEAVQRLAAALEPVAAGALLSELEVRAEGDVWAYLVPTGGRAVVPVRLGDEDFPVRLKRLRAFWQGAVEPQQDKTFKLIDLRFDGQIVTREEPRTETHRASAAQAPASAQATNGGSPDGTLPESDS